MTDQYQAFTQSPLGKFVVKNLGLPSPVSLDRFESAQPVVNGAVLLGAAPSSTFLLLLRKFLAISMQIAM
jgi:3-oxoacyl-[acyl-carrier protein] reductase